MAPSIRIGSKPTDKRYKTSISELLFLLCGVCGLLSALQDLPGAEWNMPVVYAAAIIMSTALWYTYAWGKGWFAAVFLLIIAACGFAEFRYWDLLGSQIASVIRSLTGGTAETAVFVRNLDKKQPARHSAGGSVHPVRSGHRAAAELCGYRPAGYIVMLVCCIPWAAQQTGKDYAGRKSEQTPYV